MIAEGYNGIDFGKTTEEKFLDDIPTNYVEFCKMITHRDTQTADAYWWRVQGTINSVDLCVYLLNHPEGLSNISSIKRDGKDSLDFIITINIPKRSFYGGK